MLSFTDSIRAALPEIPAREESGKLILAPATTEEVSSILTYCNGRGLPVQIAGAGTKRLWAGSTEGEVVLETARLSGVREHPWQDLTATLGAGTRWAEMQRVLAGHNQFVALDPLWPERATVGGVLASNDSGALRLRYGSARDLVIGMTIVLADGTVAKTGGKVVKNVAGYDLHKLMIGAFGTLAVITEVTFRLHPLPAQRAVWSVEAEAVEPLGRLAAAVNASHLNPEAVQIRTTARGFGLHVLLAGAPDVLRPKAEAFAAIAAAEGLSTAGGEASLNVFRARENLFGQASNRIAKATMMQTAVPAVLAEFARAGAQAVAYPLGIVYADMSSLAAVPPAVRSLVEQSGGSLAIIGEVAEPAGLMREIKRQFDSIRILNRGLMGGL